MTNVQVSIGIGGAVMQRERRLQQQQQQQQQSSSSRVQSMLVTLVFVTGDTMCLTHPLAHSRPCC
jgi:hypothetical protein